MTVYDYTVKDIDGNQQELSQYRGKTLLIVNVASRCGFTPQYKGLQELYSTYKHRGFEILGFPCNQFGFQEPAPESEIKSFCSLTYQVTFPLFSKVDVNGEYADPLFVYLKANCKGILETEAVKWNFTKFLINKEGIPVKRFAPNDSPSSLSAEIEKLLVI